MSQKPTPDQIAKLPHWAQQHIKYLESERTIALNALNSHLDDQTPSKIYFENYLGTGEGDKNSPGIGPTNKRFYVQSERVDVLHAGILLRVACYEGNNMHDNGIELQWSTEHATIDMVAMIPKSFQQVMLLTHANMRRMMKHHSKKATAV